jgi:hypothetical protein
MYDVFLSGRSAGTTLARGCERAMGAAVEGMRTKIEKKKITDVVMMNVAQHSIWL